MEGKNPKKQVGSTSPFPAELFGTKDASKTDIFASIFPPPKGVGRSSAYSEVTGSWQKQQPGNQPWNATQANKEKSSAFPEERVEPCYLSSSLYYGGQEMYPQSSTSQKSGSYPTYKKDFGEDDPSGNNSYGASRGNWWEGSLYY
ncbi:hypothetical protein Ancab_011549 [Ancistrocladus abbreviatus]